MPGPGWRDGHNACSCQGGRQVTAQSEGRWGEEGSGMGTGQGRRAVQAEGPAEAKARRLQASRVVLKGWTPTLRGPPVGDWNAGAGHLWPQSLPHSGDFPLSSRPPWSCPAVSPILPLPGPGPAHLLPSLGGQNGELATTHVALETVTEEGWDGHTEPLPRQGGELPFQPLPHSP